MTYIDDAHATGILGPHGRGIEDYFGVEGQADVMGKKVDVPVKFSDASALMVFSDFY